MLSEQIQKHSRLRATPGHDPSHFVILHAYTLKSVKEESRNEEASILVSRASPVPFEEASTLFQSINEKLSEAFVEIYAPIEYQTPTERRNIRNSLSAPLTRILEGVTQ